MPRLKWRDKKLIWRFLEFHFHLNLNLGLEMYDAYCNNFFIMLLFSYDSFLKINYCCVPFILERIATIRLSLTKNIPICRQDQRKKRNVSFELFYAIFFILENS